MAAPPLMRSISTRAVKKLEKPRPLKTSASHGRIAVESSQRGIGGLQDLMALVESVSQHLIDKMYNEQLMLNVASMCSKLKIQGQQLESIYKDQLDRAFVIFRDGCQDDGLQGSIRKYLLELVELRARHWTNSENSLNYYSAKMAATEVEPTVTTPDANTNTIPVSTPSPPAPPVLAPGEVLKTSGKFPKPTKVPGKNYCKDEVVIRNSDSGKAEVMRPLIIKSPIVWNTARYLYPPHFFRPSYQPFWPPRPNYMVNPGAKERLVQITGPSEDKINHARQLMEDTIRRNASPVREGYDRERMGGSSSSLNSSASDESNRLQHSGSRRSTLLHSFSTNDANVGEYKYTVTLGQESIKIIGTNHETVRNARLVLEEYYNLWLQKNTIGDCSYGVDDEVFMEPVVSDMTMLRLNSLDSGLDPSMASMGFQPIYTPMSQPERRPVLGRSNSIHITSPLPSQSQDGTTRKYSREFLLSCAVSQHSRATPPNWDQIVLECPAIAKKVSYPYYAYDNYCNYLPPFPPYTFSDGWTYVNPYVFPN